MKCCNSGSLIVVGVYRDYFINHDIRIPSLNNQDSMDCHRCHRGFERCSLMFSTGRYTGR